MTALLASLHRRVTWAFVNNHQPRRRFHSSLASRVGDTTRTKHAQFSVAPRGTNHHCRMSRTHWTSLNWPLFSVLSSDDGNGALLSSSAGFVTTTQQQQLDSPTSSQWSQYEHLVRKLYMTNLFNPVKLGLENMDRLHEALGRPMDQVSVRFFDTFHIHA